MAADQVMDPATVQAMANTQVHLGRMSTITPIHMGMAMDIRTPTTVTVTTRTGSVSGCSMAAVSTVATMAVRTTEAYIGVATSVEAITGAERSEAEAQPEAVADNFFFPKVLLWAGCWLRPAHLFSTSIRCFKGKTTLSEQIFDEPRLALNRIYTRRGDSGETSLAGGQRVHKDDLRIESYGTVDELNAFVGVARVTAEELAEKVEALRGFASILKRVQHELFNLGSILATLPEDVHPKQPRITTADIVQLETEIDEANEALKPLRSFVLPGGSRLDAELHVARTVCRRAERMLVALGRAQNAPSEAVQYLNRLSDALFVWSRWANHVLGAQETLWEPNAAAGAANT